MLKKFLFLGAAALAMTATSTIAADASRARLMIPIQVTLSYRWRMKDTNQCSFWYNLQYVHSSGFGNQLYILNFVLQEFIVVVRK